jgi:hypothetical protein
VLGLCVAISGATHTVAAQPAPAPQPSVAPTATPSLAPPGSPVYPPGYTPPAAAPQGSPPAPQPPPPYPPPPYGPPPYGMPFPYYPPEAFWRPDPAEERLAARREPKPERNSPGLFAGGAVLTVVGGFAAPIGFGLIGVFGSGTQSQQDALAGPIVAAVGGTISLAAGITMMVVGGRRTPPKRPSPMSRSEILVAPSAVAWRSQF